MSDTQIIKVSIIDDETNSRNILKKIIEKHLPELQIIGEAKNVNEAIEHINRKKPELIFLDIRMPDGNGFDVLKNIKNYNMNVIFVTAHDSYAMQAIKFHAFDYILKPINHLELVSAVKTLQKKLYTKENDVINNLKSTLLNQDAAMHKLAIPLKGEIKYIALQNIIRLTADQSYTWIYSSQGDKIISSKNLGEYYKILNDKNESLAFKFFRVHHSEIINTEFVKDFVTKDQIVILHSGEKIKVAARRAANFKKLLSSLNK